MEACFTQPTMQMAAAVGGTLAIMLITVSRPALCFAGLPEESSAGATWASAHCHCLLVHDMHLQVLCMAWAWMQRAVTSHRSGILPSSCLCLTYNCQVCGVYTQHLVAQLCPYIIAGDQDKVLPQPIATVIACMPCSATTHVQPAHSACTHSKQQTAANLWLISACRASGGGIVQ